jgi:hypothetical protein
MSERNKAHENAVVGLADNGTVQFMCGTCEYFKDGTCYNMHPKLHGTHVEPVWCCNLYDHDGMSVIIS